MFDKQFEEWKNDINNDLLKRHTNLLKGFMDDKELNSFVTILLNYSKSSVPRYMINYVERLVTLSDDIEKIRPGKDSLKIFFMVVCIESLYKLSDIKLFPNRKRDPKNEVIIDFFQSYLSEADKQYILENFRHETELITIESFALMIYQIRNNFTHEGIYWKFLFSPNHLSFETEIYTRIRKDDKREAKYKFDISLSYSDFREMCIKGYINFIKQYFKRINDKN